MQSNGSFQRDNKIASKACFPFNLIGFLHSQAEISTHYMYTQRYKITELKQCQAEAHQMINIQRVGQKKITNSEPNRWAYIAPNT